MPGAYLSGQDAYLSGHEAYLSGPDYPELRSREYSEAYEADDIGDDGLYDEYRVCTHVMRTYADGCGRMLTYADVC